MMKKLISPGIFWMGFLFVSLSILIRKYKTDKVNFFTLSAGFQVILVLFLVCITYTYFFDRGKSRIMPLASFFFGMAFWIPLLNLLFALPSIYFGIKAFKKIRQNPKQYGGKWFAVIGIVLGAFVYLSYLIGFSMCIYGSGEICRNMGLAFLVK